MPADVQQLLREHEHLKGVRAPWEADWQTIGEIMHPSMADILSKRAAGNRRTQSVYDSTAMWALDTFTSHLISGIMNFGVQWFGMRMRAIADDQAGHLWLDEVGQIMAEEMTANQSLVPAVSYETLKSYAGFGTGAYFLDEQPPGGRSRPGWRGYQALSLPIGSYSIAEGANGIVDTLFRECEMSPHQAAQAFGDQALAPEMRRSLTDDRMSQARYTPSTFVHAVYPRRDRDRRQGDGANMPYASCYVDVKHKHLVAEGGYRWFPYLVPRWEKLSTYAPWGWGRGHLVLPEALTLNAIDKDALRALPMHIFPPGFLAGGDEDAVGRVSLLPGTINPMAKGAAWQPYQSGGNVNIEQLQMQDRRNRIMRAFWIDQLQFLPPADQRTQRTLGELHLRSRFMARLMGPTTTIRLLAEFLNPFIDVGFGLLLHARVLPDPPDSIVAAAMANQGQIDVEYEGPLARAARDEEADAIDEAFEFALGVGQRTGQMSLLQNLDQDEAFRRRLEIRGFPKALVRDKQFVAQLREAENEQRQQQAMVEQAATAAPALKAIGEFASA
jgi:hypothetical protein